ncbi:HAMP domain-containing histidine kinase [Streptomyces kaniharaensis]|uniref:histidine kinase n=1 Tax=Streptomyces kaniharaensis TaxID=212423 RepID=A0A6N7L235_9ACTN|nr:HAMP domain-containing sensor histidine kinase [Streptomyces kaniharaensis]MQS16254.1 HAMP domain-containing histidine kinase [Streptomyces kaniharaensis]
MRHRLLPGGLRIRLVAAFALVAALAALSTGALTFREARTGILQQSQDTVIRLVRNRIDTLAWGLTFPPTQQDLAALAANVAEADPTRQWRVMATYRGLNATSAPQDPFTELTPALRTAATTHTPTVFQRVTVAGRSDLVVGMPITFASADHKRAATGLTVFVVVPQTAEQAYVQALVSAAERATLPALVLAVLLALLAARGVLRPVRDLRQATRRIAEGRLDTRLAVQGSDELADLSHTFNETAAALEESVAELRRMETKARRFAADVSHELRTPLAAMSVVTDILDEDAAGLDPDTAAAVRLISQETANLARLVEDLMEISRFDAGAAALHLDDIDLAESVQRTLIARGWQNHVDTRLPEPAALRGRVDPRRLDVVVANLIANALRHGAPPVRLSLHADPRPARDGAHGTERWAVIEVQDTGPGIPENVLPHIFDRFYKSDTARTRTQGSGLGLAITAENVHLHGGTIRAANHPHGGAQFIVELPLPELREEERS